MIKDTKVEKIINKNQKAYNPHAGHRKRLKEKVDRDPELETMHDHELLELMLSFVIPRKDTNGIAHELIDTFGSLDSVFFATPKELMQIKNMTENAAYLIATQLPIARRAMSAVVNAVDARKLSKIEQCMNEMHSFFFARKTECFVIALLDVNHKLIKKFQIVGYQPADIEIYTSDVLLKATREGAANVIIAHNHPSGAMSPSPDDIMLTRQIFDALANMEIKLLDHIIFTHTGYFSFSNNGIIQQMTSDFEEHMEKQFKDDKETRRNFILNLEEYIFVPHEFARYDFEVVKKVDFYNKYKDKIMKRDFDEPISADEPSVEEIF